MLQLSRIEPKTFEAAPRYFKWEIKRDHDIPQCHLEGAQMLFSSFPDGTVLNTRIDPEGLISPLSGSMLLRWYQLTVMHLSNDHILGIVQMFKYFLMI